MKRFNLLYNNLLGTQPRKGFFTRLIADVTFIIIHSRFTRNAYVLMVICYLVFKLKILRERQVSCYLHNFHLLYRIEYEVQEIGIGKIISLFDQ